MAKARRASVPLGVNATSRVIPIPRKPRKRGQRKGLGVVLDGIARRILEELSKGPLSSTEIAAACAGGAVRMTSPRLVWLEGLGLVESTGPGTYGITEVGLKFLIALE